MTSRPPRGGRGAAGTATGAVPVTVLTGYLGAGKTTLLNRILFGSHGRRLAVVVNEFGEIGIDHDLVVGADEEVVTLSNGCLCCTFRGDLVATLERLVSRGDRLDGILVETTGLAEPAPVAQSFYVTPTLRQALRLDGVVTVVDARHIRLHLAESPEARAQIAFADVVVLNKLDLVDPSERAAVEEDLAALNGLAPRHAAVHADVALDAILDVGAFDLERAVAAHPGFLDPASSVHGACHESGVGSVCLDELVELDAETATMWLRFLASRRGHELYRMKGILALAGRPERVVFHGVHTLFESHAGRPWAPDEERRCRLVFIGRDLDADELRRGLDACRAG